MGRLGSEMERWTPGWPGLLQQGWKRFWASRNAMCLGSQAPGDSQGCSWCSQIFTWIKKPSWVFYFLFFWKNKQKSPSPYGLRHRWCSSIWCSCYRSNQSSLTWRGHSCGTLPVSAMTGSAYLAREWPTARRVNHQKRPYNSKAVLPVL